MAQKETITTAKFVRVLLAAALLPAVIVCALVLIFDPFYHYHGPAFGLRPVLTEKEYQVVGTLRHFDYDAVLVGSSVVENNDNSWYDALFDCHTIKAVRSYGGIADLCWLTQEAYAARENKAESIGQIFFNLDPTALIAAPETTFAASGCPMYLYDHNPFNDVSYLFNKTVLFEKIPYMLAQNLSGYDPNLSYNWAEGKDFSQAGVLEHYFRLTEPETMLPADVFDENVRANAALLEAIVAAHPETTFRFFLPPYSVIWWDDAERSGEKEAFLYAQEVVLGALLTHDNVEVYDFQCDEQIVSDLNNYMDPIHFTPAINAYMAQAMADAEDDGHRVFADTVTAWTERTGALSGEWILAYIAPLDEQGLVQYR